MLNCILEWAKTKPKFNASTFQGIHQYYEDMEEFTLPQMEAIENVYYKWKVDKWRDNNLINLNLKSGGSLFS